MFVITPVEGAIEKFVVSSIAKLSKPTPSSAALIS